MPHTITTFRLQSWDHSALCEEVPTLSVDRDGFEDLFLRLEDAQLKQPSAPKALRNSFVQSHLESNINLIFVVLSHVIQFL